MEVVLQFESYIIDILKHNKIGKGIQEYERAKKLLPNDLSADEYEEAIRIVADYIGI